MDNKSNADFANLSTEKKVESFARTFLSIVDCWFSSWDFLYNIMNFRLVFSYCLKIQLNMQNIFDLSFISFIQNVPIGLTFGPFPFILVLPKILRSLPKRKFNCKKLVHFIIANSPKVHHTVVRGGDKTPFIIRIVEKNFSFWEFFWYILNRKVLSNFLKHK